MKYNITIESESDGSVSINLENNLDNHVDAIGKYVAKENKANLIANIILLRSRGLMTLDVPTLLEILKEEITTDQYFDMLSEDIKKWSKE